MKLFVDACISPLVAARLREAHHDVVHAADWGRAAEDKDILERAYGEGRTIITLDKDIGRLIVQRALRSRGVVRLVDLDFEEQVQLSIQALSEHESQIMLGGIVTITRDRSRIRFAPRIGN